MSIYVTSMLSRGIGGAVEKISIRLVVSNMGWPPRWNNLILDSLAEHFAFISSNANYEKTQISFEILSKHTFPYNLPIIPNELTIIINKNSKNTSPGPDHIHSYMLIFTLLSSHTFFH